MHEQRVFHSTHLNQVMLLTKHMAKLTTMKNMMDACTFVG